MKSFGFKFMLLVVLTIGLSGNVWAGQFGTPQPAGEKDGWSMGAGYFLYRDKLDFGNSTYNLKQNQFYVQAARVLGRFEIYLRGGMADMDLDHVFGPKTAGDAASKSTFESDSSSLLSAGLKGSYQLNRTFAVGGFVDGTVFPDHFKDDMHGSDSEGSFTQWFKVKNMYNINLGASLQAEIPHGIKLYAGPYAYWTHADATYRDSRYSPVSSSLKNKSHYGGFAGASFGLSGGLILSIETQVSEKISGATMITYCF